MSDPRICDFCGCETVVIECLRCHKRRPHGEPPVCSDEAEREDVAQMIYDYECRTHSYGWYSREGASLADLPPRLRDPIYDLADRLLVRLRGVPVEAPK